MKKNHLIIIYIIILLTFVFTIEISFKMVKEPLKDNSPKIIVKTVIGEVNTYDSLSVSVVGDCTIGTDPAYGYERSFTSIFDNVKADYGYFFRGVNEIIGKDDLTIANLETTFTEASVRANKRYTFKGPKEYANILTYGSIEAVNIANNHTKDYLEKGYLDTVDTLDEYSVPYFGEGKVLIHEVKGIKIGLIGYYVVENPNIYKDVEEGLEYLKSQDVDLIFVSYHWGIERSYKQNDSQVNLAHWTIDNGADFIIGHHPHVIQGIEKYKDKYIVYSLANFVFGGNRNPNDKDTFIFQLKYNLHNGKIVNNEIEIIPASVSSRKDVNDYQPQILTGEEKERVLQKILKSSVNIPKIE